MGRMYALPRNARHKSDPVRRKVKAMGNPGFGSWDVDDLPRLCPPSSVMTPVGLTLDQDLVLSVIATSVGGCKMPELRQRTAFNLDRLSRVVCQLSEQGRIHYLNDGTVRLGYRP